MSTGSGSTTTARHTGDDDTATDPNVLAEQHLYLVQHVVNQLCTRFPRHVDRSELVSAGTAGLVDAAHRYDPATGVPFTRYAAIRVRGAVIDATRTRDWATRRTRRELRSIAAATEALQERLDRHPDDAEIAAELGVGADRIREHRAAQVNATLLALDQCVTGPDGAASSLVDLVVEEDEAWIPEAAVERNELVETLRTAVAHLPEEPRTVLVAHHFEGRLLRDVADELGVTEARASQLRYEALHALQAYFGTLFHDVPAVPVDAPGKRRRAAYVAGLAADANRRHRRPGADHAATSPRRIPA